jgi:hypothetical protein
MPTGTADRAAVLSRMLRGMARRVWKMRHAVQTSHQLYAMEFNRRRRAERKLDEIQQRARVVPGDFPAARAARYILGEDEANESIAAAELARGEGREFGNVDDAIAWLTGPDD